MKKPSLFVLFFFLVLLQFSFAQQPFQRTLGNSLGDYATTIKRTSDSGFIITGSTWIGTGADERIWLIKTNSFGDTLWTRYFGGSTSAGGIEDVVETHDSGYLVVSGDTYMIGNKNIYLCKFSREGDLLWTRSIGGSNHDYMNSVEELEDEGFILSGYSKSYGTGNGDAVILRTDKMGNPQWMMTYGGADFDIASCIRQTPDHGFIVVGRTASFGAGNQDCLVFRIDSAGALLWSKTYGGTEGENGLSVCESLAGFLVAGTSLSYGAGGGDIMVIKINATGDIIWSKTYGGNLYDGMNSIQRLSDGNFIISGSTQSFGNGSSDAYLLKINENGDLLWSKTYGGADLENAYSSIEMNNGEIIFAGQTKSSGAGGTDIFLVKTDAGGYSGCTNEMVAATITGTPAVITTSPVLLVSAAPLSMVSANTTVYSGLHISNPCILTSDNEINMTNRIVVYPDPVQQKLNLGLSSPIQNARLTIINTHGQTISEQIISDQQTSIDVSLLPRGLYFICISNDSFSGVGKFIKE
jgi:hypothetical protein